MEGRKQEGVRGERGGGREDIINHTAQVKGEGSTFCRSSASFGSFCSFPALAACMDGEKKRHTH